MEILTINDIEKLTPFLKKANYNEYNSNIVTMMMWQFSYPVTYEIHETFAVVKWHGKEGCSWMMPLCEKEYWKQAVDYMKSFCRKEHGVFSIVSATEEFKQWCEEQYPGVFLYEDLVDAQDYVYLSEQHKTLSGKKMQKRRNHYNAFVKEYENRFLYKPLNDISNEEILAYLDEWNLTHTTSKSLVSERKGIQFILKHRKELALLGGGIYMDGCLQAFLIASALSDNTLEIHVEKANKEIRGLYIAMLKHFLMHQDEKYTYINREDDMGLDYLRIAKTNMHPVYKIKKYGIYLRETVIRKAADDDIAQIKSLWQQSFQEETEASTEFYFQHLYHKEDGYVLEHDGEILTMLQCRKIKMMINDKAEDVSFIVGVATKQGYRHNGLMRELLTYVLNILKNKEPLTILQAYDWNLYKPFGFQVSHYRQLANPVLHSQTRALVIKECHDAATLLAVYERYCQDKNGYRIRDIGYYEDYLLPYLELEHGKVYVVYDGKEAVGCMILQGQVCSEYLPLSKDADNDMQQFLYQIDKDITIWAHPSQSLTSETIVPCMMVRYHKDMILKEPLFINEVL